MAVINSLILSIVLSLAMQTTGPTSPPATEPVEELYSKQIDGARVVLVRECYVRENRDPMTKARMPFTRGSLYVLRLHSEGREPSRILWYIAGSPLIGIVTPYWEPQMLDVCVEATHTVVVFNLYGQSWARVISGISDDVPITLPKGPICPRRYKGDLGADKHSAKITGSLAEDTLRILAVDQSGQRALFKLTRSDDDGQWVVTEP